MSGGTGRATGRAVERRRAVSRGPGPRWRGDGGAGAILGVALVAVVVCVTAMALPLYAVLVTRQALAGAADAAALAAADVRVGILPGEPCAVAATVAAANGAGLSGCVIDGLVVTVAVTGTVAGFAVGVSATAGPPDAAALSAVG
jgi:secretion/DNA translocation related TadE-like protein